MKCPVYSIMTVSVNWFQGFLEQFIYSNQLDQIECYDNNLTTLKLITMLLILGKFNSFNHLKDMLWHKRMTFRPVKAKNPRHLENL